MVVLLLAALCLLSGCATKDYYRLKQTRDDIDWKMTRYRNEFAFNAIPAGFEAPVNAAYQGLPDGF
jgi:hypothetical protein